MPRISTSCFLRIAAALLAAIHLGACKTTEPAKGTSMEERLKDLSIDKRSAFFNPQSNQLNNSKKFHTKSISGKDFYTKTFLGSKSYKTEEYGEANKSSFWGKKNAWDSNRAAPPSLTENYSTHESRLADQSARESAETKYRTGDYKTGEDVVGSRKMREAQGPKILRRQGTMSESEVQNMLLKY